MDGAFAVEHSSEGCRYVALCLRQSRVGGSGQDLPVQPQEGLYGPDHRQPWQSGAGECLVGVAGQPPAGPDSGDGGSAGAVGQQSKLEAGGVDGGSGFGWGHRQVQGSR
ncbi:hypothetical protein AB0H43_13755 [Hamadaea sp. NPDC050747]|uniref:hypothetical protein n=1 Tax=Hamadaea sp. NPDC050747 TaxID=3155789 RepID=UPI0033CA58FE